MEGSLDFAPAAGTYTLSSKGRAMTYGNDSFFFASSRLAGDGEVTVRVNSMEGTTQYALAGLHFRSNLSRSEPSASILLRNNDKAEYRVKPNYRANNSYTHSEDNVQAPYFLRMVRVGDDFAGFVSEDGSTWREVARWMSVMPPVLAVGLAVCAGTDSPPVTATFDNFSIKEYNTNGLKGLWRFTNVLNDTASDSSIYAQHADITDAIQVIDIDRGPVLSLNGGSTVDPRSGITEFGSADYTLSGWFKTSVEGGAILAKLRDEGDWNNDSKMFITPRDDVTNNLKPAGSVNMVSREDGFINGGQSIIDSQRQG